MRKVIVAEDDVYLREAYVTILKASGYDVRGAENGKQALEAIEQSKPDVLLIDMLMPVMGGLEALAVLENKALLGQMKVIAFTNLSDKATLDQLEAFGVDKYLLKSSVTPKELVANIEEVMSKVAVS
jgi:Response regulator containing CheY-like receiver, AAA-type ATPase, and DNA-binding domains